MVTNSNCMSADLIVPFHIAHELDPDNKNFAHCVIAQTFCTVPAGSEARLSVLTYLTVSCQSSYKGSWGMSLGPVQPWNFAATDFLLLPHWLWLKGPRVQEFLKVLFPSNISSWRQCDFPDWTQLGVVSLIFYCWTCFHHGLLHCSPLEAFWLFCGKVNLTFKWGTGGSDIIMWDCCRVLAHGRLNPPS